MLCDDLERWEGDSGERGYVYIWLVHDVVQEKLIKHCKTIIFQFKISTLKNVYVWPYHFNFPGLKPYNHFWRTHWICSFLLDWENSQLKALPF